MLIRLSHWTYTWTVLTVAFLAAWLGCLLTLFCSATLNAAEPVPIWPTARGDFAATGSRDENMPDELKLLWESKTAEAIEVAPVSDGERVYVVDVMGGIEALELATGNSVWRHELETGFVASPSLFLPTRVGESSFGIDLLSAADAHVANPDDPKAIRDWAGGQPIRLVSGDVEGNVTAWDPATGEVIWKQTTEGEISAAPSFFVMRSIEGDDLILKSRVLVTSQDGSLYCYDLATGAPVWKYQTGDQIRCGASIGDGKTYLGGCDGGLHVVDLRTGLAARDALPLGGPTGSTPAILDGVLYQPIMDGVLYAFRPKLPLKEGNSIQSDDIDSATGETAIWEYSDSERAQEYRGSVAVNDQLVVVTSRNKTVDAIDRQTGKLKWRITLKRRADASPVIAGSDVWIASTDGRLVRLSLADGTEKWNFEIRGAFFGEPAPVGDRLVIADDEGVVRCFGLSP